MSETKSAEEIEDILSSIRRLVSEDLRPLPRPQIISKLVLEDKLILTPALRVVSSRPGAAKPAPEGAAAPQTAGHAAASSESPASKPSLLGPRLHLEASDVMVLRSSVPEPMTQTVDQQKLDWESETGDPGLDVEGLDWSSFTFARRTLHETWNAYTEKRGASAPDVAPLETGTVPSDAREATAPMRVKPWAQPDPGEAVALKSQRAAAPASTTDGVAWADEAEAKVLADLQSPAPQSDLGKAPDVSDADQPSPEVEDIFSEDVLRELVRDLIREQLQGDLGERITRNIRKLVKAEIARALAVQALE